MKTGGIALLAAFIVCWFFIVVGLFTVMGWIKGKHQERRPIAPQRTSDVLPFSKERSHTRRMTQ